MTRATATRIDEASRWELERHPGESLRACLERTLRDSIREGSLRAGVRLPASRALAAQLGVSRGVASDAYAELEAQGYLIIAERQAPVVAAVPRRTEALSRPAPPTLARVRFDMTPSTPDLTLFPRARWLSALTAVVRSTPVESFDYGESMGHPTLREKLADELGRTRGVICDPSQIIIVQGSAQGIDLALRTLMRYNGARRIAVEDPSLERTFAQIDALGLELLGQPVDSEGLVVEGLHADAVIVSPAHQFPTGEILSGARRRELIEWSGETGGVVIEDDYDAEFRYYREPVRALQGLRPDRVMYLGTCSKTLAPALRLGWLVVPQWLVEGAEDVKSLLDDFSPTIEQLAFARLLERGDYQRQIRTARAVYRARRDRLAVALEKHLPELAVSGQAAGLHVTLCLPPDVDDRAVEGTLREAGIALEALTHSTIEDRGQRGLVLGYGHLHETAIEAAVIAMSATLRSALNGRL